MSFVLLAAGLQERSKLGLYRALRHLQRYSDHRFWVALILRLIQSFLNLIINSKLKV